MSMYVSIASTIATMEADNNLAITPVECLAEDRTPVRTSVAASLRRVAALQLRLAARIDGRTRFAGRQVVASV